jgi:hypothetical protein
VLALNNRQTQTVQGTPAQAQPDEPPR